MVLGLALILLFIVLRLEHMNQPQQSEVRQYCVSCSKHEWIFRSAHDEQDFVNYSALSVDSHSRQRSESASAVCSKVTLDVRRRTPASKILPIAGGLLQS